MDSCMICCLLLQMSTPTVWKRSQIKYTVEHNENLASIGKVPGFKSVFARYIFSFPIINFKISILVMVLFCILKVPFVLYIEFLCGFWDF